MPNKYSHFDEYEWLGYFSTPDKKLSFPGKLSYTPEEGLILDFLYEAGKRIDAADHLHGVLATGEKCTLFGDFNPIRFGSHFGQVQIYKSSPSFDAVVFNVHTSPEEKFAGFALDMQNFQEFCHPQGFKDYAKYSDEPLHSAEFEDLTFSILNTANFSMLGNDIDNIIHCDNPEVMNEISSAVLGVLERHKGERILQRKDIGWEWWVTSGGGLSCLDVKHNIFLLENFISLLFFSPTRRTEAYVLKSSQGNAGKFHTLPFLVSLFDMSKHKIKVLTTAVSHNHLAINPQNVPDFGALVAQWFNRHKDFQLFVPQIANRFGRYHEHELQASIVLNLTQIEAIAKGLGFKKESEKFDAPIRLYDKGFVRDKLAAALKLDNQDGIGMALSSLRGEIAHTGRPIKILPRIGLMGLMRVGRALQIIVATHIYTQIGVPENNMKKFQKTHLLI